MRPGHSLRRLALSAYAVLSAVADAVMAAPAVAADDNRASVRARARHARRQRRLARRLVRAELLYR